MHLAERNMWRIAAKLLWAFEFHPYVDSRTGQTYKLDPDAYNPGILQAPLPFKIGIKPRSTAHIVRIRQEFIDTQHVMEQFE